MSELLSCANLACGYDSEVVLSGVDLTVSAGQILTILGGSGSGKSTLLRTLIGLLPPISGEVRLLGEDPYALEPAPRRELYRRAGVLYQRDALFGSMSVLENVELPLREASHLPSEVVRRAARARIALVDLLSIEFSATTQISGGQSKRIALARASILDPCILFCDEPTSGLDPLAAEQVDTLLLRFRETLGMAIVAVTHDVATVRTIADQVIFLQEGTVRVRGTVPELEASSQPAVQHFFRRGSDHARSNGGPR